MSEEERVEQAFKILSDAKVLESKAEYWDAAEQFVAAHGLLKTLAEEASVKVAAATTAAAEASPSLPSLSSSPQKQQHADEQIQIANLYASKAVEYWNRSRHCLIRAMQQEKERDEMRTPESEGRSGGSTSSGAVVIFADAMTPPCCENLDDSQAVSRNKTFVTLFSKQIAEVSSGSASVPPTTTDHNGPSPILDQQWSIEERLNELNKSLPSGFKTTDERMVEINRGLNKLGLSLYTQKEPFARFQDTLPKSEEEQMDEIMAQAQDEVATEVLAATAANGTVVSNVQAVAFNDDDDDDHAAFSDDDDEDDDGDEFLEDDQLAIKIIRKKVIRAQIKIAELVAVLDEAKAAKDKVDQWEDGQGRGPSKSKTMKDDDDSEDASLNENVHEVDVSFILGSGKRKLKSAQRNLRKALREWDESSL